MSVKLIPLCFVILFSVSVFAADNKKTDAYDLPQIVAVEGRMYNPVSDFTGAIGVLPLDAYYKALTLGVGYTRTLNASYKWTLLNAHVAFTNDTGLKKDLLANFAAQPQGILDYIKYYVTTDLVYSPIYGKNLLFNKTVIRTEMSLLYSAGAVAFNSGSMAPMVGFGGQIRFYSSPTFSYKFDTRLYYHLDSTKSSNMILSIGFGFSFDNPGDRVNEKSF